MGDRSEKKPGKRKKALSNSYSTLKVWQGMTNMWPNLYEEYRHPKYSEKFYDTSASGSGFKDPSSLFNLLFCCRGVSQKEHCFSRSGMTEENMELRVC